MAKVKFIVNQPVSGLTADFQDVDLYGAIKFIIDYGGYGTFYTNGNSIGGDYYPHVLKYSISNYGASASLEFGGNVTYNINYNYNPYYEVTGGVINHYRDTSYESSTGLDSVLEAGATGSKRSMMPRSLMKKR